MTTTRTTHDPGLDHDRDRPGEHDRRSLEADHFCSAGVWCETESARAAIAAAIDAAVAQLRAELPRACAGEDPEGVHQARVATRRLRSDLRTFGALLDDDWRTAVRSELKWLADSLGRVRDCDVLRLQLVEAIDEVGVDRHAADPVLDRLDREERAARRTLIDDLTGERAARLLAALADAAADPPTVPQALGRAELRLRPLVRRPWRKLVRMVERLDHEPSVPDLHRVRLLAKRARYAADAVGEVCGRPARRLATALAGVQDVLGRMNDAEVAAAWLQGVAGDLPGDAAFAAGELACHFRGVAEAHRHGWESALHRAHRRSAWLS